MKDRMREARHHITGSMESLINQYSALYASYGIKINFSIKNVKPALHRLFPSHNQVSVFTVIENAVRRVLRRNEKNSEQASCGLYVVIQLRISGIKLKAGCREYAFLIKRPMKDSAKNEKILQASQKIFEKKLVELETKLVEAVCKNRPLDIVKYVLCGKYAYKKDIMGMDLNVVRFVLFLICGSIFVLIYFLEWYQTVFYI